MMIRENTFSHPKWWKEAVIYQIYPASFKSHEGAKTGWGSIKGITSKLDYIKSLGANVVWSSPILKSPQADMGYDIADYKQIDERYGTLDDVDELIAELKKRDMRLMMDLVVNHTSNEHYWFKESASSKDNPKRNWYHWQPPKRINPDGTPEPPNNWGQILGEGHSAWEYDETTGEFYLCLFSKEQPDLNWETPEVREAVWDVMHFWMKRGASGFRMDVINLISKVPGYPDADITLPPGNKYQPGTPYYTNGPRLHEFLHEMHDRVLSQYDTITVGEMPGISDPDEILRTVGAHAKELRMIFIFDVVDIDRADGSVRMMLKPWGLSDLKRIISKYQRVMIERDGWNSVFIENHDNPRSVSRYTSDATPLTRSLGAKLLALMQTTLGGTLFVYQGEEIGMRNMPPEWSVDEFKDIETVHFWEKTQKLYGKDDPEMLHHARAIIDAKARDHSRTPVQWEEIPGSDKENSNSGFCDEGVKPWMRVNSSDTPQCNVKSQLPGGSLADSNSPDGSGLSVWQFWQRCLSDRRQFRGAFVYGDFEELHHDHPQVFAYVKTSFDNNEKKEKWLVLLNFSGRQVEWYMPPNDGNNNKKLEVYEWPRSNYVQGSVPKPSKGMIPLKPWEGVLGRCKV